MVSGAEGVRIQVVVHSSAAGHRSSSSSLVVVVVVDTRLTRLVHTVAQALGNRPVGAAAVPNRGLAVRRIVAVVVVASPCRCSMAEQGSKYG